MVNRTRELAARDMPTAEEFALWGARELSFEELLAVNGGGNVEGAGPVCGADPDIPDNPGVPNEAEETSPTQGGGAPSVDCTPPSNTGSSDSGDSHGSGSTGGSSVITGSSYTVQEKDTLSDIVRRRYPDASAEERVQKIYELAEYNGISDIDRIEVGQLIFFEKPAAEGGAGTPPVQQGGANIGTTPGGTQAGSASGAADTVGQLGNENAAPVQGSSSPNTGGVASVPPVQNESGITQQAASAQNPVPQVPATAEKKKSEGLWSGLWDWGKRKLDSIGQGIVAGSVYAMDARMRVQNESGITQQAASAQNPVPQPVVVAGEGEKKGIKTLTNKIADTFFKNDGAKTIHTIGGAASRTTGGPTSKAGSIGLYINPENEALFNVATKFISTPSTISKFVGISLITANIEDIGCYVAIAGGGGGAVDIPNTELSPSTFVGLAVGSYKSVADAQGPYQEIGGSIGKDGLSVGIDAVKNLENETIGYTTSIGFTGKPLTFEAHYRVGVTKLYSFTGKTP